MSIIHERYPSGADTGEDMLEHEGEEGGVVIAGEIELTVAGEARILRAGDAYYFDSRLPHRFRNLGEEECVIVSANSPPTFSEGGRSCITPKGRSASLLFGAGQDPVEYDAHQGGQADPLQGELAAAELHAANAEYQDQ